MPQGLYIDYNDGRPPMVITSGLRAVAFVASFTSQLNGRYTVPGGIGSGDRFIFMPLDPVVVQGNTPPTAYAVRSFNQDSSQVWCTFGSPGDQRDVMDRGELWRVMGGVTPATGTGLLIQDSTNFTSISNDIPVGTLGYAANITFTGQWTMPISGTIFANWNNANVVVERRGNIVYCVNRNDTAIGDPGAATVSMRVAIFTNSRPVPGNGLTIVSKTGLCTFSTIKKPFVLSRLTTFTETWQGVGDSMVPLACYGSYYSDGNAPYYYVRRKGVIMYNNGVQIRPGTGYGQWYSDYGFEGANVTISYPMPVIPNFY